MKKVLKTISCLLLVFTLVFSLSVGVFAKDNGPLRSSYSWEVSNDVHTDYFWQLTIKDYKSERIQTTSSYTTEIEARSAAEAEAAVSAGAGAGAFNVSASLKGTTSTSGMYKWTVSYSKVVSKIQFYDRYYKMCSRYYIAYLINEQTGAIFDKDEHGRFIETYQTTTYEDREGRSIAG